jgi:hypothetical protein
VNVLLLRLVIASSDDEPDDVPRRTKFSVTGLQPDQEDNETNTDLWWDAMRAGNMVAGGVLPMAQHDMPPIKPNTTRRRKKRYDLSARTYTYTNCYLAID